MPETETIAEKLPQNDTEIGKPFDSAQGGFKNELTTQEVKIDVERNPQTNNEKVNELLEKAKQQKSEPLTVEKVQQIEKDAELAKKQQEMSDKQQKQQEDYRNFQKAGTKILIGTLLSISLLAPKAYATDYGWIAEEAVQDTVQNIGNDYIDQLQLSQEEKQALMQYKIDAERKKQDLRNDYNKALQELSNGIEKRNNQYEEQYILDQSKLLREALNSTNFGGKLISESDIQKFASEYQQSWNSLQENREKSEDYLQNKEQAWQKTHPEINKPNLNTEEQELLQQHKTEMRQMTESFKNIYGINGIIRLAHEFAEKAADLKNLKDQQKSFYIAQYGEMFARLEKEKLNRQNEIKQIQIDFGNSWMSRCRDLDNSLEREAMNQAANFALRKEYLNAASKIRQAYVYQEIINNVVSTIKIKF